MADPLHIVVTDKLRHVYAGEFHDPVELGRQREGEEIAPPKRLESGAWRLVIAKLPEVSVARQHALIESLPGGNVRVTNRSTSQSIILPQFQGGMEVRAASTWEGPVPLVLTLGTKTVRVERPAAQSQIFTLSEATRPPGRGSELHIFPPTALAAAAGVDVDSVVLWLQTTMEVLQSAASSSDFFAKAAEAVVDLVGLETGCTLLWQDDQWTEAARNRTRSQTTINWRASRHVLEHVRQDKKTVWELPAPSGAATESLHGVQAVVAAPILDGSGAVIGVLYGDRREGSQPGAMPQITKLEAMLVQLLACSVAAGLARLEQEKAALRARVQIEQFFTRELAEQLATQPDLLHGRDAEVTVLFCDIRRFSQISERLAPSVTVDWISDVMGVLSDCVMAHRGVLVDYVGDELMAMWGAPTAQADHAELACRAALDMLAKLPMLSERWLPILPEGQPMGVGIGLNSGTARVGNTGSQRKFKYGPLGNMVNLASRVQGATKYLKTTVLITGSTQAQLGSSFQTRRLCQVRVVNIADPVELFELLPSGRPGWPRVKDDYERALEQFERRDFRIAVQILGNHHAEHPDDGPALVLLSRAVNCMVDEPNALHPVWELPGK